jgi:ABC-type amino acid transport system permease subunit
MDDLLGALAGSIPALVTTHGPTFVVLLLSIAANVALFRETQRLNKLVNDEIKAGIAMATGFEETFRAGIEAIGNRRSR